MTVQDESYGTLMQNVFIALMIAAFLAFAILLCVCAALFSQQRLAAAMLTAGLLLAFAGLAVGVETHAWVTGLDSGVASWFSRHKTHGLDVAASVIAAIGSPSATAVVGLIGGALLSWRARSLIPGAVVIGTVGAAALAETSIKALVETSRFPDGLQSPHGLEPEHYSLAAEHHRLSTFHHWLEALNPLSAEPNSFPSGHVTGTAALLGIIAVCLGVGRSRIVRGWLAALVVASVLVVAVSRLYLRVHWLTDVIGGALLAGVFVTLGGIVLEAFSARSGREGAEQRPPLTNPPVKVH